MTYFDSIISKAKWWSIGTELHYGEEIPTEAEMDARRRKEIKRLASEWGKTVDELKGQVEEV